MKTKKDNVLFNRIAPITSVAEWLEGGDYFDFIKNAEIELGRFFPALRVIKVDRQANWYVGKANIGG